MGNHYWRVRMSYLGPPSDPCIAGYQAQRWRENIKIGVVAPTIDAAVEWAKRYGVPEGGSDPIVWAVNHGGAVDGVVGVGEDK